jgi:hypothetical protein
MSDTNYDPLKRPQHSTAELRKLLLSPQWQRLSTENPELFKTYKKEMVEHGLLAPPKVWQDPDYRKRFDDKPLSEAEMVARSRHSEQETRDFFSASNGATTNASTTARDNPELYREMQLCGRSYGILPPAAPAHVPPVKQQPVDQSFVLDSNICKEANLPNGFRCESVEQFGVILKNIHDAKEAKAKAAVEQAAKDAANDASVSSFGHVRSASNDSAVKQAA